MIDIIRTGSTVPGVDSLDNYQLGLKKVDAKSGDILYIRDDDAIVEPVKDDRDGSYSNDAFFAKSITISLPDTTKLQIYNVYSKSVPPYGFVRILAGDNTVNIKLMRYSYHSDASYFYGVKSINLGPIDKKSDNPDKSVFSCRLFSVKNSSSVDYADFVDCGESNSSNGNGYFNADDSTMQWADLILTTSDYTFCGKIYYIDDSNAYIQYSILDKGEDKE